MATNNFARWVRNIYGAPEPFIFLALFQDGNTQAIKAGEILELTGDGSTAFVPIDSDFLMLGHIAVANEEIKDGDRAGYYEVIVPRPGDEFEFTLAAASALAVGTRLYFSSSEKVTASAGAFALGHAIGQTHYPQKQGHLTDDAAGDAGVTIRSTPTCLMTFAESASYLKRIQANGNVVDFGDAGGHSGWSWAAGATQIEAWVDGALVADLGTDGVWSDLAS